MSSLGITIILQSAVSLCNKYKLKREILCASGSYYELRMKNPGDSPPIEVWIDTVENAATEDLNSFPVILSRDVMGFVFPMGMRMLTWAVYHERTIRFSSDFCMDALDQSCFTQEGLLDNKTVAEKLMEGKSLNIQQKYKLACLYCFEDNINDLYRKLTPEDIRILLSESSGLTEFWIYYSRGEADKLRGEKTMDEYRLEKAVESGSKAAVEYSWKIILSSGSSLKNVYIQNAAIHAVRNSIKHSINDCAIFLSECLNSSWVPSSYFSDILFFLLSKMTVDQKKEFLETDTITDYIGASHVFTRRSMALEYSLSWPYQGHFLETAKLMWEFFPEENYAALLLMICDKISPRSLRDTLHGEETFDYRQLFEKFWLESPERCKECVLSNAQLKCPKEGVIDIKSGTGLLSRLLTLRYYSVKDDNAVRSIFAKATDTQKQNIFSDKDLGYACVELAKETKWHQLNTLSHCFASIVEEDKFKSEFFRDWRGQDVFIASLRTDKWEAFKEFAKWCALPDEILKQYKKELINSESVVFAFRDFLLKLKETKLADEILMWCFSSEEEIEMFKKDLIFLHTSELDYECFLSQKETNCFDEFIKWCLSSKEEIKRLKKKVLSEWGCSICRELVYKSDKKAFADFERGPWGKINNFFNWCLLSDKEISDFKRDTILGELGEIIFSRFIRFYQHDAAENFFAWLNLPTEEINKLRQDILLKHARSIMCRAEPCNYLYVGNRNKVSVEERNAMLLCCGFDWEIKETELFLKFCLTDEEAVTEFEKKFKETYADQKILPLQEDVLKSFWKMVETRLGEMGENETGAKETGVKRKFQTLSP